MNQNESIIKSGIFVTLSSLVVRFQGFFTIAILARLLSPSELGLFNLLQNLLTRFDNLSKLGIDCAIIRNGAQFKYSGIKATGRLFGSGTLLTSISGLLFSFFIFINRSFIAENWINDSSSEPWIGCMALSLLFTAVGNPPWFFLLSLKEFKTHSINTTYLQLAKFFVLILITFNFGYRGAILSLLVIQFIYFFQGWLISIPKLKKKNIRLSTKNFFKQSISIFKLGLPFYSSNLLVGVIDIPLFLYISKFGGLDQLGYLRVAQTLQHFITFLPNALSPIIISYLSQYVMEDLGKYFELKSINFRILGVFTLITLILCQIMLEIIVPISFGESYQEALNLSRISLINGFFITLVAVLNQYIVSKGKTTSIAFTNLTTGTIKLILALILIPIYSVYGFLISNFVFHFLNSIIFIFISSKDAPVNDNFQNIKYMIISISSIFMVLFIISLDISLLFRISFGLLLSILTLYLSLKFVFTNQEQTIAVNFIKSISINRLKFK